jgi:hypothetical protein
MFTLIDADPPADQVCEITFVPFLPDGRCVLIEQDGPRLPAGAVLPGEDYLLDTVLRVPLETAGFRYQRFRPFGLDDSHLYAWIEGGPYLGDKPHARPELSYGPAGEAARRLRRARKPALAEAVTAAAASYRDLGESEFYADNLRTLERSYLRGRTPQEGSGFGGDQLAWRQARRHITEAIAADGSFLDVGCANGLLMESVAAWADRIWAGNAIDWVPPRGRRFDYVHILLDCVPVRRRADLIRHHLAHTLRPATGRLLVSDYAADPATGNPGAAGTLRSLGIPCMGQTSGGHRPGRIPSPTAWLTTEAAR